MTVDVTLKNSEGLVPRSAGANTGRMKDLVRALHADGLAATFLAAPIQALGADIYHASLSDCLERHRGRDRKRVAVTPEAVWVAFCLEVAGRVRAAPEALATFRQPEPTELGLPYASGNVWPSDAMAVDLALFPREVMLPVVTYSGMAMPPDGAEEDFSHVSVMAGFAAHADLAPAFELGGAAPFWHPDFRTMGFSSGRSTAVLAGLLAAGRRAGWAAVAQGARNIATIAEGEGAAGDALAAWAREVAAAAEALGAACGGALPDGHPLASPDGEHVCGLARLLAPAHGASQAARLAFRHHGRDLTLHFGLFWCRQDEALGAVVPELGWVLAMREPTLSAAP